MYIYVYQAKVQRIWIIFSVMIKLLQI